MKTKADVITAALRKARIVAIDETPDADVSAVATTLLDGLTADFQQFVPGDGFWSNIPEHVFLPLVRVLAAEVAPEFGMEAPEPRDRAMAHLMAQMRPDDREDATEVQYF